MLTWKVAMAEALYGPQGFYQREHPDDHFRTSVSASPLFAAAIAQWIAGMDRKLGHPDPFDVVDIGAARGALLQGIARAAAPDLGERLRLIGVEVRLRPGDPELRDPGPGNPEPARTKEITWTTTVPDAIRGVIVATEWLDNVPLDVAEVDPDGVARLVLVDPTTGHEALGDPLTGRDAGWVAAWWPGENPGEKIEIGWPRDDAWSAALDRLVAGAALAVDYGHLKNSRPTAGTLTGFHAGREVPPVPDGSCDVTAHVSIDSLRSSKVLLQRAALAELGVHGARPPLAQATSDPAGYVAALARAGEAAELRSPSGLGGHYWLFAGP